MKKALQTSFIVLMIVSSTVFCKTDTDKTRKIIDKATIENLKNFTEIYGLIMNFYPAPKRDSINWNNYLAYSVNYIIENTLKKSSSEIFRYLCTSLFTKVEVSPNKLKNYTYDEAEYFFLRHVGFRQNKSDKEAGSDILLINLKQAPPNEATQNVLINFKKLPEVIKDYAAFSIRIPRLINPKDYSAEKSLPDNSPFSDAVKSINKSVQNNTRVQWISNLAIIWNTFKYFYPYKADSQLNLDKELDSMMKKICSVKIDAKTFITLTELFNKVNDAHFFITGSAPPPVALFPFRVKRIKNKFIISDVFQETNFKAGDELLEIDKIPVVEEFNRNMKKISGSKHYKESISLKVLGPRSNLDTALLKIRRGGKIFDEVVHTTRSIFNWTFFKKDMEKYENGIYYINLTKATYGAISKALGDLSGVKGLIVDFRGYPEDAAGIMLHLTKDTLIFSGKSIPVIYDPTGLNNTWRYEVMKYPPLSPYFNCPKIFLTESATQGQSESWLEMVKQYKLGKIVGTASAGGNGNNIRVNLIGGYYFNFTRTRVLDYEGSKIFLKGVIPDTVVNENDKITEKKDFVLEEAIKILKKEINKKNNGN